MKTSPPPLVWCDPPSCVMTPDEARAFAMHLVEKADRADGGRGLNAFVTRADVLAELLAVREAIHRLDLRF